MNLFEKLKQAIYLLNEEDLYLSKPKALSDLKVAEKKLVEVAKKEQTIPVENEKLPFNPIRKPVSKPLFSQSLNLEKKQKQPPKIEATPTESTPSVADSFQDIKTLLKSISSNIKIFDELPDDSEARRLAKLYEKKTQFAECLIFYENPNQKGLMLLKAVALAIEKQFTVCTLHAIDDIEQSGLLEEMLKDKNVKLIITCHDWIIHHPKLLNIFNEKTGSSIKKLGTKDVIVLSNLEYYMKDPALKRSLWNLLMSYFKNNDSSRKKLSW